MGLRKITNGFRKYAVLRRRLALLLSVIVIVIVGGTTLALHHSPAKSTGKTSRRANTASHKAGQTLPTTQAAHPPDTDDADKQAAAHARARPVTDACKLLTQAVAMVILGGNAQTATPDSAAPFVATNTAITGCKYSTGSSAVQLMIRRPNGALGVSENATVFGSGKPSGAATVSGYGQAAYWDPSAHTLNVLGDNNWYIISRGGGSTQADAEATAKLLAAGF